jgi:chemotaxis response regulator CheB
MSDDDQEGRPSEEEEGEVQKAAVRRFPTVGIGASAGGVHALQTFFESLPDDVDAALSLSCISILGIRASSPTFWPLGLECR